MVARGCGPTQRVSSRGGVKTELLSNGCSPAECETRSAGHDNKAFIHAQSHIKLPQEHKELWSVLTGSLAMSEETRACLVQACNYHFCLLLRTPPNHPPQTWKPPKLQKSLSETSPATSVTNIFIHSPC